jgi:hypothetical protein
MAGKGRPVGLMTHCYVALFIRRDAIPIKPEASVPSAQSGIGPSVVVEGGAIVHVCAVKVPSVQDVAAPLTVQPALHANWHGSFG